MAVARLRGLFCSAALVNTLQFVLFFFLSSPVKHVLNLITSPSEGDSVDEWECVVVVMTYKPLLRLQAGDGAGRARPGHQEAARALRGIVWIDNGVYLVLILGQNEHRGIGRV